MATTPGNAINEVTTGICGFTGTAFTGTPVTIHNILIGGATSSAITQAAPSATSGIPVISQGSSSDPIFGTAVVAGGGTGQVTLTNHGVLVGAATSAISQTAAGSAGQVLQSGGASADPSYSTATYPVTSGTSGNVLTSDGTNFVSSAPAATAGILVASGNLTNGEIKALHATPKQIIAAPGNGKVIQILNCVATLNYGGTNAFTDAAASQLRVYYSTTTNIMSILTAAQILATASQITSGSPLVFNLTYAAVNNLAVNLYNDSATEWAGNAANDNTMSYNITYRILTIP